MKKSLLIIAVSIICIAMAAPVFAGGTVTLTTAATTKIGGANFIPSTNVSLCPMSDTINYCVSSLHSNSVAQSSGREWGSYTQASSSILYKSASALTAPSSCEPCDAVGTLKGGNTAWTAQ